MPVPSRQPSRRTAWRRSLAALAATLLALSLALATAQGQDDDPVVVQAGAVTERLSDVEWRFFVALRGYVSNLGMAYSDEIGEQLRTLLPQFLEQRANELVLLNEADRRGIRASAARVLGYLEEVRANVPEGGDYAALLANAGFASEAQLAVLISEADRIEQLFEQLESEATPTADEVRVRFIADRDLYATAESFCARHILVAEEAFAQELLVRIQGGELFEDLAREHGTDGTANSGGDLGCFGRGRMVAEFEDAVVTAPVGEAIGPVASQFGYHLVLVYEHAPAAAAAFEDVRSDVEESIVADRVDAKVTGLLRGGGATTFPERLTGQEAQ